MSNLSRLSILELANRLNQIEIERQQIYMKNAKNNHDIEKLDKEYNDIVYELWNRIPSLTEDVNIQPKKRVRRDERS